MMNLITAYNFQHLVLFIVVVVACLTSWIHGVEDEWEFSYDEDSEIGPAHWGEIKPEWKKCSSGKMQSPIDLLSWPSGAGNVEINGTLYQLTQAHWHSPSEHSINGRRLDMELHLVHQTNDNRTAVIAVLYKFGQPDSFMSMIKHDLEVVKDTLDVEKNVGIIDPKAIKFDHKSYYRYMGSLTTPPCTEDVVWTIATEVRPVSREQVELIRDAIHDDSGANARPIQPLNDRVVKLYISWELKSTYNVVYLETNYLYLLK